MSINLQDVADDECADISSLIDRLTAESTDVDKALVLMRIAQEVSDPAERVAYVDAMALKCGVAPETLYAPLARAIEVAELAKLGCTSREDFSIVLKAKPVCGPLRIRGITSDAETKSYGVLVSLRDREGVWRDVVVPQDELVGRPDAMSKRLAAAGLIIWDAKTLAMLLHAIGSDRRIITYAQCGWNGRAYMFPDEVIGGVSQSYLYNGDETSKKTFAASGTLADWKDHVATPLSGNSRLILAVSAAFAAPLLHVLNIEGGGFHFVGGSSCGKTTAVQVAASVFGKGSDRDGYVGTWRTTDNAMESVAYRHNHALLCVDEIGQSAKNVGETVYMIANGQGKGRSRTSGDARPKLHWLTLMLSTGELDIAEKVEAEKGRSTAGQAVRLVDIPADAGSGHGLFETFPDDITPGKFADNLKRNAATFYGTAARAFVAHVAADYEKIAEEGREAVDRYATRFAPVGCASQVLRVAKRFALAAYAGELAISAGVAPWDIGEAENAARVCFDDWLARRGTTGSLEAHKGTEAVLKFIELHGQSRFQNVGDEERPIINRAGFKETTVRRNGDGPPSEVPDYPAWSTSATSV